MAFRLFPLHVLRDGCDLREGVDAMPSDLSGVTTAGASPAELSEAYSRALDMSDGDGVLAVHISRQLSGTWEAGRVAAQEFGGAVRIVDSQSAGMGLGYPALEAARLAEKGASLEEAYGRAVDVASRGRCYIVVDKLDQLRRGGRIGTAGRTAGHCIGHETDPASGGRQAGARRGKHVPPPKLLRAWWIRQSNAPVSVVWR